MDARTTRSDSRARRGMTDESGAGDARLTTSLTPGSDGCATTVVIDSRQPCTSPATNRCETPRPRASRCTYPGTGDTVPGTMSPAQTLGEYPPTAEFHPALRRDRAR